MHYYKRNIGDYHKKAGRLTMLQHGAYTLLMDACYDREKFPSREEAIEWLWASSTEEIAAIDFVLGKFFVEIDGVFVQHRIQTEVNSYTKNSLTNKRIAIEREEKRRLKSTNRAQDVNDASTNRHLTTNQEPLTTNQELKIKDIGDKSPVPYQQVLNAYHEILSSMASVQVYSDKRKKAVKAFFSKRSKESGEPYTIDKIKAYFEYIRDNCQWMMEDRPNGNGGFWKAKNFDYILKDDCYISVREDRHNDTRSYCK